MDNAWKKQFELNYTGMSDEAKELQGYMKEKTNYKYIPWATMERLTYMQDPGAKFEVIETANGDIIHTTKSVIVEYVEDNKGLVTKTEANNFVHMVIVDLTFLGKTIRETYPIQKSVKKQGMIAPKTVDANLVNKAIQRAKAKVASRNTGIGLKLYETGDLQFEEDEVETVEVVKGIAEPKIPKVKAPKPKVTKPKETKVKLTPDKVREKELSKIDTPKSNTTKYSDKIILTAAEIRNEPQFDKGIRILNKAVLKQYKVTLKRDETLEDTLSKITNLDIFYRTLKKQSGLLDE